MSLSKSEQNNSLQVRTQCSQMTKQDGGQVRAGSGRVIGLTNPVKAKRKSAKGGSGHALNRKHYCGQSGLLLAGMFSRT